MLLVMISAHAIVELAVTDSYLADVRLPDLARFPKSCSALEFRNEMSSLFSKAIFSGDVGFHSKRPCAEVWYANDNYST